MNKLEFLKLTPERYGDFRNLMLSYSKELDEHRMRQTHEDIVLKWTESIIKKSVEDERYLELCVFGQDPIGFLSGKIDKPNHKGFVKPGYGYIMEFYILPQYRRKGYGKEMYYRIEELFKTDGARRIYLTADPITGEPFWEYLGFVNTGEVSPENGLCIYEREIPIELEKGLLLIKHPNDGILRYVADKHGSIADKVYRGLKNIITRAQSTTGYFCAVLYSEQNEIIGYADFIQNSKNSTEWFYTDLWVSPEFRRQGNAKRIISGSIEYLKKIGANALLCTVMPENEASINTQRSLGFNVIKTRSFEFFDTEDLIMFEKRIK